MKYTSGDIVRLKDDGNDDFIILLTKESIDIKDLLKGRDYVVKKINSEYIRHVFEENMYQSSTLDHL